MKKYFILALLFIVAVDSFSAKKKLLLEEFTGAWCGWCPNGTYYQDSLTKAYPNDVIGIRHHTGDAMASPETQSLYNNMGPGGVPSSGFDRLYFDDPYEPGQKTYLLYTDTWFHYTDSLKNLEAKVDVNLSWNYDEITKTINGKINAEFLEDINYQTTFIVFVCEDSIVGTGSAYDQNNYISQNPDFVGHPYYFEPAVIKGYHHNRVVRQILGGIWGTKLVMPKSVKKGDKYSWTFSTVLNDLKGANPSNIKNVFLVGSVGIDEPAIADILNSNYGVKENFESFALSLPNKTIYTNKDTLINIYINNNYSKLKTYSMTCEKIEYGADWAATFIGPSQNILVDAKRHSFQKLLIPISSEGMAKYRIKLIDTEEPNNILFEEITVYNTASKKIFLTNDVTKRHIELITKHAKNDYVFVDYSILDTNEINKYPNLKLVVDDNSNCAAISDYNESLYRYIFKKGASLLVIGNYINKAIDDSPKLKALFSEMNLEMLNSSWKYANGIATLKGISTDPVTNEADFNLNFANNNVEFSLFNAQTFNNNYPILKNSKNNIFAVRGYYKNIRYLFAGFSLLDINDETKAMSFFDKSVFWLLNDNEKAAHLYNPESFYSFQSVTIGTKDTIDIPIFNIGTDDLTLNQLKVKMTDGESLKFFLIENSPALIHPKDSAIIKVGFESSSKSQYKGALVIYSNDKYRDSVVINLTGRGKVNSIQETKSESFDLEIFPNPINTQASLKIFLKKEFTECNLRIIDISGKLLYSELIQNLSIGENNYTLPIEKLNSGTYLIEVKAGTEVLSKQIIVYK